MELLRSILTSDGNQDTFTSRMAIHEISDIIDLLQESERVEKGVEG
jgi:hypothetical protein